MQNLVTTRPLSTSPIKWIKLADLCDILSCTILVPSVVLPLGIPFFKVGGGLWN